MTRRKQKTMLIKTLAISTAVVLAQPFTNAVLADNNWKDDAVSPVTNPLFFENPRITTEVRPIFMEHNTASSFVTGASDLQVLAAQVRWAINDRLAFIATKDGYIFFHPAKGLPYNTGFADLAAGLKYAVVDDLANQLIVTPGLTVTIPTGTRHYVFQGYGWGEENLFVSGEKAWGKVHVTANTGFEIANDSDASTSQFHYSGQVDYHFCNWFIPFASANGFTVVSNGKGPNLSYEGYDLINFGSGNASGFTQIALGTGFRSQLSKNVDFGFAWEKGITTPRGIFDDRYTVDFVFHF